MDPQIKPLVSIAILTKNGGSDFESCLIAIYSQLTDFKFEVIIVDSGSTDGTLRYLNRYPVRLYKIKPYEFSFGPTRDYAFSLANGKYIVTLSQDVIPANREWLSKLVKPLIQSEADAVQGRTILPRDKTVFYWEKKGLFYFTSEGDEFIRNYGNIGVSFCSFAIKRNAWSKTRFGDAVMCEDKVIQRKLGDKGYKITNAKDSIAYHGHNYNLKSLINRCENEGLGWRYAGVRYPFSQMIGDVIQKRWVYKILIKGLLKREIKTLAETLFLLIRPISLFKGNRFNKVLKS
ncbi:glycosyltransferases [Candidatus Scalindua japonica]|uniref:Glycosyltransferases n=1 Tax=Candidatus Scalindua japonica TaxID=1284222 RepID=A0A286U495_9BACT|nr:glycosyltransferase family 2 protein [Candidatus Scalindua japonica]GAX62978.1 glycosyltransferases [Candidatus Scalindua japonica]